jgi:uncharacterized protein (DUF2267 family)
MVFSLLARKEAAAMLNIATAKFEKMVHEANLWIADICSEMGYEDRQVAYHALRGVLFALRDRLPMNEVFNLAAQLPTLIRGIFFEGYRGGGPIKYNRDQFVELVNEELRMGGGTEPQMAIRAVLMVLSSHVSEGEVAHIREVLPADIRALWPEEQMARSSVREMQEAGSSQEENF